MNEKPGSIWTREYHGKRSLIFLCLILIIPSLLVALPFLSLLDNSYDIKFYRAILFALIALFLVAIAAYYWHRKFGGIYNGQSFWSNAWNEPRRFFAWLTFFLLIGISGLFFASINYLDYSIPEWLEKIAVTTAAILVLSFALSFTCMGLAWIPPVRRLLASLLGRRLFVLACLITLVALFYAEENWRGKHAWDNYRLEWEAKGERFDRASVIPPAVPDDQNFALTPIVASCYSHYLDRNSHTLKSPQNTNVINQLRMPIGQDGDDLSKGFGNRELNRMSDLKFLQEYYRALAAKTNLFPVAPEPQTSSTDVLLALSKYDSPLEELRQASLLPYSRFPLGYDEEDPAAMLLPHLGTMKECSTVLRLRAIAELQIGQSDKALEDIKLALRLADSVRTEPILVSHLVRIAILQITLLPIWEGLAEHKWSDAQLFELDRALAGLDFLADYKASIHGQLALFQGGIFDYLRQHPELCLELFSLALNGKGNYFSPPIPPPIIYRLIPSGWFYQNQLRCARAMVELFLPLADTNRGIISPTASRHANAIIEADTKHLNPFNFIEKALLPALSNAVKRYASGQSSVDLARVAIALERYHLVNAAYPVSLDLLVPQFIDRLPHDVINGQPLHYRREAGGQFVLYSVGWNETDDGGVVAFKVSKSDNQIVELDNGDWVWRYPAKNINN